MRERERERASCYVPLGTEGDWDKLVPGVAGSDVMACVWPLEEIISRKDVSCCSPDQGSSHR